MSRKTLRWILLLAFVALIGTLPDSAFAQRRVRIGGPFGIAVGGGQGLTIGGGYGVQVGGGQGLRFGPPRAGVQYGGGQGVRFGTPNFGVQYGGGQLLRYGAPNAGVRIGGGEGVRLGTAQGGVRFGNGTGLQVGRFRDGQVAPLPTGAVPQQPLPAQPVYQQPLPGQSLRSVPAPNQPIYQGVPVTPQSTGRPVIDAIRGAIQGQPVQGQPSQWQPIQNQSQATPRVIAEPDSAAENQVGSQENPAVSSPMPSVANPISQQTQFDAARQATGSSAKSGFGAEGAGQSGAAPQVKIPPVPDVKSTGKSILERK